MHQLALFSVVLLLLVEGVDDLLLLGSEDTFCGATELLLICLLGRRRRSLLLRLAQLLLHVLSVVAGSVPLQRCGYVARGRVGTLQVRGVTVHQQRMVMR